MKKRLSIQLKAAFLLMIFSFNMVVGFACALGIGEVTNASHHHEEAAEEHSHINKTTPHHDDGEHKNKHSDKKGEEEGCCTDKVVKIAQVDKTMPQLAKLISPVFLSAFVVTYYDLNISYPSQLGVSNKYLVLGHHPPIPDIRIAIQSFQI
jgi:hypothetical protein